MRAASARYSAGIYCLLDSAGFRLGVIVRIAAAAHGANDGTSSRPTAITRSPIFPDLARDQKIDGPDQLWVADITYIAIETGFECTWP